MTLIACRDVSFAYEGVIAVSGLDFEVNDGDYLCIVGENGSGKSTLVKGLLRLKQPVKGRVVTDDSLKTDEIGYLPQQTVMQRDFPASVYEVVLSGRLNKIGIRPFYSSADKTAANENIKRLGIEGIRNRRYGELSIGQQRRVLLARALCATQKVLLLDEPAAGLDPVATHDLYRLITDINHEMGITIIMVSHDIHSVVKHAGHILHLKNAQEFFGTTVDYLSSAAGLSFTGGKKDA